MSAIALPELDVDAWMQAAASFGAKYAVLVASHMTGFALWPTLAHNISIARTKWKGGRGDVVADFLASCGARGIAPGLFYSTHFNWALGVNEYIVGWPRLYGGPALTQGEFEAVVLAQLAELAAYNQNGTGTPTVAEIWFDGGVHTTATPLVGPAVRRLFPAAVCHSCANFTQADGSSAGGRGLRWMGNEEGAMPLPSWGACGRGLGPYGGDPQGAIYAPPSADTVLSEHYWFWQRPEPLFLRSTCALVGVYLTSVGRAANLILNLAPTDSGALEPADVRAYAALGAALACLWAAPLGEVLNVTVGEDGAAVIPWPGPPFPARGGGWALSLHLQEDLEPAGQRIAAWTAEACVVYAAAAGAAAGVDGGFGAAACTQWVALLPDLPPAATTAIGHKRIVQVRLDGFADNAAIAALRVTVFSAYAWADDAAAPLVLARVALYDLSGAAACVPANCTLPAY